MNKFASPLGVAYASFVCLLSLLILACVDAGSSNVARSPAGTLQGVVRDGTLGLTQDKATAESQGTAAQSETSTPASTGTETPPQPTTTATPQMSFGRGLQEVLVSALVDGKYETTRTRNDDPSTPIDEAGTFSLGGLPTGVNIPVTFTLKDYAPVRAVFLIPGAVAAGTAVLLDRPQLTIDIDLVKATGKLTLNVFANKGAAAGATVLLDLSGTSVVNTTGTAVNSGFDVFKQATTNKDGQAIFEGLPATLIPAGSLVVLPYDASGDLQPDFSTYTNAAAIDLSQLTALSGANVLNVNLETANAIEPAVVWTNISANRPFSKAENIILVFSAPMDDKTFTATLTSSNLNVAFQPTWDTAKVKVTLDPLQDLEPGNTYKFTITRAVSLAGQFLGVFTAVTFPVIEGASALPSPKVAFWSNPDKSSTKTETDVDYNTRQIDVQWSAVADAVNYLILAKDNKKNSDWVQIAQKGPTPGTQFLDMDKTTQLPAEFDAFTGDTDATPFAFGTQIALAVVSMNRDGIPGVVDKESALVVSDKKAPMIGGTAQARQSGQVNIQADDTANDGSGKNDKILVVRLAFSEFMDTSVIPTVNLLQEGANDTCSSLGVLNAGNNAGNSSLDGTWAWDQDGLAGTVKVKIPAGQDAREDCVEFNAGGLKDSSGNGIGAAEGATTTVIVHRLQ